MARLGGQGRKVDKAVFYLNSTKNKYIYVKFYLLPGLLSREVVGEASRLLEERDHIREARLEALRGEIAIGIEQGDKEKVIDGEEVFRELREDIHQISNGE